MLFTIILSCYLLWWAKRGQIYEISNTFSPFCCSKRELSVIRWWLWSHTHIYHDYYVIFPSKLWSNLVLAVFIGLSSVIANDHDTGPSEQDEFCLYWCSAKRTSCPKRFLSALISKTFFCEDVTCFFFFKTANALWWMKTDIFVN